MNAVSVTVEAHCLCIYIHEALADSVVSYGIPRDNYKLVAQTPWQRTMVLR